MPQLWNWLHTRSFVLDNSQKAMETLFYKPASFSCQEDNFLKIDLNFKLRVQFQ